MTELRFHRELYIGTALDEAVKVYQRFARFDLSETPEYWVVSVEAKSSSQTRQIVGEFSNYALGLTIRARQEAAEQSTGAPE